MKILRRHDQLIRLASGSTMALCLLGVAGTGVAETMGGQLSPQASVIQ